MSKRIAFWMVFVLVICMTLPSLAQRLLDNQNGRKAVRNQIQRTKVDPPGTIDGAKNPELISDFKAYEVFFHSVAIPETAVEAKIAEAKSKLRRAELGNEDLAILLKLLGEFYRDRSNLNVRFRQLKSENAGQSKFTELDKEANNLVTASQIKLIERLSQEGRKKVHQHVMGLKTKIKLRTQI